MQARTALAVALAGSARLSPAKELALAVWADDGGMVIPGSGGEVVFYPPRLTKRFQNLASSRQKDRTSSRPGHLRQRA